MRFISYLFSFYLGILTKRYIHLFKAFSIFFNFTILGLKPKRFLYNEKFVFFYERERGGATSTSSHPVFCNGQSCINQLQSMADKIE